MRLGAAIGDPDDPAEAIDRLREQLGLTAQLSALGVDDEVIDAVCRMSEGNDAVAANPRDAGPDEVRQVIEAAY
jgi:alcohol dehydrogenase class IV